MNNFSKKAVAGLALVSSLSGTVNAANLIFTNTQDWSANPQIISVSNSFTWTHDIASVNGYVPDSEMFIESARLVVNLLDFETKGRENISFVIGNDSFSQFFNFKTMNNGSRGRAFEMELDSALFDLREDGQVTISLFAPSGSFQLVSSTLTAIDPPFSSVPEPENLALLALGLLCCALAYRPRLASVVMARKGRVL